MDEYFFTVIIARKETRTFSVFSWSYEAARKEAGGELTAAEREANAGVIFSHSECHAS